MTSDPWGSAPQAKPSTPATFDDVLNDPFADTASKFNAMADSALGHAVMLLVRRGDRETADLVLDVDRAIVEFDRGDEQWTFWLEIAHAGREFDWFSQL